MKEIVKILIGSQNYGLNGPDSDEDYKVIYVPQFNDLYNCRLAEHSDLREEWHNEHYSALDVRKWCSLLIKGNINALEMLYSSKWEYNSFILYNENFDYALRFIRTLYENKYVAIVWDNFFAATKGLCLNSIKRYGITEKSASRAKYFVNLLTYIVKNNFVINQKSWRNEEVANSARAMRFGNVQLPTEEEIHQWFDEIEAFAAKQRGLVGSLTELWEPSRVYKEKVDNYLKQFIYEEMLRDNVLVSEEEKANKN